MSVQRDGIDGSGVATLMVDAGLTNGAFYAHFDSKEDLVANTVADQIRQQREAFRALPLEEVVRGYLSIEHRSDAGAGCPSAALLDEAARSSDAVKRVHRRPAGAHRRVAARLAPADPRSARVQALGVFALMVGTLQVSRALSDQALADELLEQGIRNALALLGTPTGP